MPKSVEAKKVHFVHRLLDGPFLSRHTVGCDENASTVYTTPAMDENAFVGAPAQERKELRYLIARWRRPAADGNTDKMNA